MSKRERSWPVPLALVALSAIPLTAGALRLVQVAGGPTILPADHRFAEFPLPLIMHIVGATTYLLVGILQLVPRFRALLAAEGGDLGRFYARVKALAELSKEKRAEALKALPQGAAGA